MAKRHLLTTEKQYKGQYYTTVANKLLNGWEKYTEGKCVLDPFVGAGDLLRWASNAKKVTGYDIDPAAPGALLNDSLMDPPDYTGSFLISNPPYLSSNKCRDGDKRPYQKWGQSDYYKCHLASLLPNNCEEGILILPSNFISESNAKARELFFSDYEILELRYWREPTFEDTNTGIVAFVFKKASTRVPKRVVPTTLYPQNVSFDMTLERRYKWLWGQDFFDTLNSANDYEYTRAVEVVPNTNIVVGCLDNGRYSTGFHYNEEDPIIVKKSVITTFQLMTPYEFTLEEQKEIVRVANELLANFREQYHSMFLSNYLGATQKIMSQTYAFRLVNAATDIVLGL
jgi:hypothetical protein